MSSQKENLSISRREIRGITLRDLLQYGSMIACILSIVYSTKNDIKNTQNELELIKKQQELINKDIEIIKTYFLTNEVWKARIEEKLNLK